ncbi:MAG: LysR family transcriptional regulator [Myxococcota bacterium]
MQPKPRFNLNDLDTFERVARLGTLSAAAEELGVPKSTVGRRIARLEAEMEVVLLHRGARYVTLTESGRELEERSREALGNLRTLSLGLAADRPHGVLRLTMVSDLMMSARFASMLEEFRNAYPEIVLDIDATPRVVDIIAEGFDIGFRPDTAQTDTDTLLVRRLGASPLRIFGSEAYFKRRREITGIQDLENHDWVAVGPQRQVIVELSHQGESASVVPRVVAYGSDMSSVLSMLRAGVGLAVVPPFYVQDEVDARSMVPVLPEWQTDGAHLLMVWPRQRFELPRVRAFVDFMARAFSGLGTSG